MLPDDLYTMIMARRPEVHAGGAVWHPVGKAPANDLESLMVGTFEPIDPRDLPRGERVYRTADGLWKTGYDLDTLGLPRHVPEDNLRARHEQSGMTTVT